MISKNEKETKDFAKKFAKSLNGGEVILLSGNLGAGKTVFVKGLAEGLGVKDIVNSPTFVLMKVYKIGQKRLEIRPPQMWGRQKNINNLIHIDAYRVGGYEDLKNIGFEDFAGREDCVVVVEWGEKIKSKILKSEDKTFFINLKINRLNSRLIKIIRK